jgi:lysophospholipase L1-like esterase
MQFATEPGRVGPFVVLQQRVHMKLIFLGIAMLLAGCGKTQIISQAPAPTPGAWRFLALGDSYTIGESVEPSQRWPVQLAAALRSHGVNMGDPTIIAVTGWTTANLSAGMDQANPQEPYDLVGLLIGVNNQYQGRSEEEYRRQFAELLSRSIALAGGKARRVIVLSIPDWGVTPFARLNGADPAAVGAAIDRFNAINQELTEKSGAEYVDITPVSRQRKELVADDGLHPSGEMYGEWVKLAEPVAERAITDERERK